MSGRRRQVRVLLWAVAAMLLVWGIAGAEHAGVTFSQTNTAAGGVAIRGIAQGGYATHGATGVVGKATAARGVGVWGKATAGTGDGVAVRGDASSTGGVGVLGRATATSGSTAGVKGVALSAGGYGVWGRANSTGIFGEATATTGGATYGVYGTSASPDGRGVYGLSSDTSGTGISVGVQGQSNSTNGYGVIGSAIAKSGNTKGVFGEALSPNGTGVFGFGTWGVLGVSGSTGGRAVQGWADAPSGATYGVYGRSGSPSGAGIFGHGTNGALAGRFEGNVTIIGDMIITDDLTVRGTKNFVQPHPTQPGNEIVYVALEGPEAGTYIRGTARLDHGQAVINLPEHFALVTADDGVTVQLTPLGGWLQLYVVRKSPRQIVVREASGKSGEFDYLIQGIRRGYTQHQVIRTKTLSPVAQATRGR